MCTTCGDTTDGACACAAAGSTPEATTSAPASTLILKPLNIRSPRIQMESALVTSDSDRNSSYPGIIELAPGVFPISSSAPHVGAGFRTCESVRQARSNPFVAYRQ